MLAHLESPGNPSSAVIASPDLRTALLVQRDGTLRLADTRRGRLGAVLRTPDDGLAAIAWSPDSSTLAIAFDQSTVLWRIDDTGFPQRIARVHSYGEADTDLSWRTSVVFSPDSRHVAVAQEHLGVATMFDAGTGRQLRAFRLAPGQTMSAAAFTPDGRTLAAAVANTTVVGDGRVVFFDTDTGTVRRQLTLHSVPRGIAYTNGGRRFVTLHVDRASTETADGASNLQIWDTASLRAVGEPLEFPAGADSVSASPDGRRVVNGSDAGFAVVWDLDPAHWATVACNIAGRSLTEAEWSRYLPGHAYAPACNA